jgi:hypothetical protein
MSRASTGAYKRSILSLVRGDDSTKSVVTKGINKTLSEVDLVVLMGELSNAGLDVVCELAHWNNARTCNIIKAIRVHFRGTPQHKANILTRVVSTLSLDVLSTQHIEHSKEAILPVLEYAWNTQSLRQKALEKSDALSKRMGVHDALTWLDIITQSTPSMCTYERFNRVFQMNMRADQRATLVPILLNRLNKHPESLKQEDWFDIMFKTLQFANPDAHIKPFERLISTYTRPANLFMLQRIASNSALQHHPIQSVIEPTIRALESQLPASGSLSLIDHTVEEGSLSIIENQDGKLTQKDPL